MRLWSLHPRYLDPKGLVALWREALLAQAVLRGQTRGYTHHPQLQRFQEHLTPRQAMNAYLQEIHAESVRRGYSFDRSKFRSAPACAKIPVGRGQLEFEWEHLMAKLAERAPDLRTQWKGIRAPRCHPLFRIVRGPVAEWERS